MNVLGICGSLRQHSTNKGLLRYAQQNAPEGMQIEIADLNEVPFYNADLAEKPPAVERLWAQLEQADALLLACPEYNYSLAPALKNALDWASRERRRSHSASTHRHDRSCPSPPARRSWHTPSAVGNAP